MAKRGKSKPAGGRGGRKPAAAIETENAGDGEAAAPMGIENALVIVTFIALLVGLVLSQIELSASFGKGLF